jgi:hypothetical protein
MALNVHRTGRSGEDVRFSSYLFVTQIASGRVSNLSTGIVTGSARLDAGMPRLSALHVRLDSADSVAFRDAERGSP